MADCRDLEVQAGPTGSMLQRGREGIPEGVQGWGAAGRGDVVDEVRKPESKFFPCPPFAHTQHFLRAGWRSRYLSCRCLYLGAGPSFVYMLTSGILTGTART